MQEMRLCLSRLILTFDMELSDEFDPEAFRAGLRFMRAILFTRPLLVKATRREGRESLVETF